MLELKKIGKDFGSRTLFKDLDLFVPSGERFFILGPSGCGKTTLLRIIAGLEPDHEGCVVINDRPVAGSGPFVPPYKRSVGLVFQDGALWPHLNVESHLTYGSGSVAGAEWHDFLLRLTGLEDRRKDYPPSLSGGERQRLSLTRALACRPDLLLFDEPLRNLDRNLALELREAIVEILEQTETTSIFVTHDHEEALSMAHRILLMGSNGPVQIGTPEEIYDKPETRWIASFFGPVNSFSTLVESDGRAATPFGRFPAELPPGTACEVLFRASHLEASIDGEGVPAVIRRKIYQGRDCILICECQGITVTTRSRMPPSEPEEVYLKVVGGPIIISSKNHESNAGAGTP